MTVRPPNAEGSLPQLVLAARDLVDEQAEAMRVTLDDVAACPESGSPYDLDHRAWASETAEHGRRRSQLFAFTQQLIFVNAYDHMVTLSRSLVSDGAMPLYSHTTLSRVVCEAAIQFAWLQDPSISSDERVVRGAVALVVSAEERLRGVRRIPAGHFPSALRSALITNCLAELTAAEQLVTEAGLTIVRSNDGKKVTKLALGSPKVSVSAKLDITALATTLLPDSPSWYNISSGVVHSYYWGLRDTVIPGAREPLALAPNLLDVGAAAQSAISASGLIIARCSAYHGSDPEPVLHETKERRAVLDPLMLCAFPPNSPLSDIRQFRESGSP